MTSKIKKQPLWIERAMQGGAYWMGHRRCLYRDYPLSDGALVAEVCNLIYANLPRELQLLGVSVESSRNPTLSRLG
jgi:hypothetical protein